MARLTVLSPHRDDAAFSLSIALSRWSSVSVECSVVNLFTQSGYAPWLENTDPQIVSAIRREEDRAVLREINPNIEVHDEGFLDAPLRTGLKVDQVCNLQNTGLLNEELLHSLESVFASCRSDLVLAPLTLGDHIDHVAVHQAALRAFPTPCLGFYEDLPYAMWTAEEVLRGKVKAAEEVLGRQLSSLEICDPLAAKAKPQVIAAYRSQITIAEADEIAAWSRNFGGGERIWLQGETSEWRLLTD